MTEASHTINIAVHVVFGTIALVLGLAQLVRRKGDTRHARLGRGFLICVWIVVGTAALGVVVFRFRAFLAVITLLVAYWAYSGYRALRIRETGPTRQDGVVSVLGLAAASAFVVFIQSVQFPWSPAVIYSTLGSLVAVATYDLARLAFPRRWFASLWLYEHLVKMIGAFNALVSAFAGTVLVAWQPYSQLLPSVVCTAVMVGFVARYWRRSKGPARDPITATCEAVSERV